MYAAITRYFEYTGNSTYARLEAALMRVQHKHKHKQTHRVTDIAGFIRSYCKCHSYISISVNGEVNIMQSQI